MEMFFFFQKSPQEQGTQHIFIVEDESSIISIRHNALPFPDVKDPGRSHVQHPDTVTEALEADVEAEGQVPVVVVKVAERLGALVPDPTPEVPGDDEAHVGIGPRPVHHFHLQTSFKWNIGLECPEESSVQCDQPAEIHLLLVVGKRMLALKTWIKY